MSDLIDGYIKSGLVSDDYTRNFVECEECLRMTHPDDLNSHSVCELCKERIDDEKNN